MIELSKDTVRRAISGLEDKVIRLEADVCDDPRFSSWQREQRLALAAAERIAIEELKEHLP